ncbi:MAG: polysaccharide biosynthesis/export family protein [Alkalilacustris sp.]
MIRVVLFALAALVAPLVTALPAEAQAGYRIQPGDTLRVEVLEDSALNRDVLVLPDGRISMPLAGRVAAAGRTLDQLEGAIAQALAPGFAVEPTVFVALTGVREATDVTDTILVSVIGQANAPGILEIRNGSTLLQAFAAMGGFTRFAATRRVQLRRVDEAGVERVFSVNFREVERGAIGAGAIRLLDGDVIIVPERRLFE